MTGQRFFLTCLCGLILSLAPSAWADSPKGFDKASCSYNGIPLHGRVQIVDSFPDIKLQKVDAFPDLKVQTVENFPDSCGQFQLVDSFPDLKIQYVDAFPDLKVQRVASFPGTN
ncbi:MULTISPECIES: hypothetical protein [unclassified Saccharibacter]|uniref:hypothetical protein n=1 Tax=unclassified Saccharibacter TaxID=2648722 RepID=UPI0013216CE6|nr:MULTISPECIES: hypothetical protein [unclassified Saccharibacter]MXV36974.1 hypothetical protein [Saccharibacter sp. EH611]MXV58536.1 hypothetical protein [Saccharibacter sp. EH70]MXV66042.1 hypothetical protein [Saccharibacter sp. EH60]